MNKSNANASVSYNGDFFEFITMSEGMLQYADPDVPPQLLVPTATDEELGNAARQALAGSKRISAKDFQALFKSGVVQKNGKERESALISKYGYKSRRSMYLSMKSCSVSQYDDRIDIQPLHHNSIDGFSATKQDESKMLSLPIDTSDANLGKALKEGFCRCTSEWP